MLLLDLVSVFPRDSLILWMSKAYYRMDVTANLKKLYGA